MKAASKKKNILLIGFMGAGKTTIAEQLSTLLQMPMLDSDKEIEKKLQKSVLEIFEESEKIFRDAETKFLQENLCKKNTIFSLGGGIIGKEKNRVLLSEIGFVFFVHTDFETLYQRITETTARPIIQQIIKQQKKTSNRKSSLQNLYNQRLPYYKMADFVIANTNSVKNTATKIAKIYQEL